MRLWATIKRSVRILLGLLSLVVYLAGLVALPFVFLFTIGMVIGLGVEGFNYGWAVAVKLADYIPFP